MAAGDITDPGLISLLDLILCPLPLAEPIADNQLVILLAAVSVLLFLFVSAVLLCFVFGQHWRQQRTGAYGVQAAWRGLRWPSRAQST